MLYMVYIFLCQYTQYSTYSIHMCTHIHIIYRYKDQYVYVHLRFCMYGSLKHLGGKEAVRRLECLLRLAYAWRAWQSMRRNSVR